MDILEKSCINGDIEYVEKYLDNGGDIEFRCGPANQTPLLLASTYNRENLVKLLLDRGTDTEAKNNGGITSIMMASLRGNTGVVRLLFDCGATIDARDNDGWTAIMYASRDGHIDVVRFLIDCGADIDAQENDGWTSIMMASRNGHENIVRLLVDVNARLNTRNEDGDTVLSLALGQSRFDIALPLASKMIPDHGIPYSGAPISTFVPQNESAPPKEYAKTVLTIVPLYLNRAIEDPQFAFDMQYDIEEILRGKTTEYQWALNEKEKNILTKLLKTLRSIDYTDRTVENICIQDADKQKNEASFSYTYDMEL